MTSAGPAPSGRAGVFDQVADTYDNVGVAWFRPIAAGLVQELAPRSGERVLDVGCGRGAALTPMARAVGADGYALGIDLAATMVARTAADLADLRQVEVRVGDAINPALPAASFDVVASSLVLFFLPDPGAALRTWTELLVAGGRLGVATFGAQDQRWRQIDAVFTPFLPPALADARTTGRRGPFASDADMEVLLERAELVDVRTAHRTVVATFRDANHWVQFSQSHGQKAMWDAVPAAEQASVRQHIIELASGFADDDGQLRLRQDVRYTLGRRAS